MILRVDAGVIVYHTFCIQHFSQIYKHFFIFSNLSPKLYRVILVMYMKLSIVQSFSPKAKIGKKWPFLFIMSVYLYEKRDFGWLGLCVCACFHLMPLFLYRLYSAVWYPMKWSRRLSQEWSKSMVSAQVSQFDYIFSH